MSNAQPANPRRVNAPPQHMHAEVEFVVSVKDRAELDALATKLKEPHLSPETRAALLDAGAAIAERYSYNPHSG